MNVYVVNHSVCADPPVIVGIADSVGQATKIAEERVAECLEAEGGPTEFFLLWKGGFLGGYLDATWGDHYLSITEFSLVTDEVLVPADVVGRLKRQAVTDPNLSAWYLRVKGHVFMVTHFNESPDFHWAVNSAGGSQRGMSPSLAMAEWDMFDAVTRS